MNDLISRQEALYALGEEPLVFDEWEWEVAGQNRQWHKDVEAIKSVPSAQKKGRWVHDGYDFPGGVDWIHCSECGKRGTNVPSDLSNFCPNCGSYNGENNNVDE